MLRPADLRIVDADTVRPHELADVAREQRIERLLRADRVLRDPLTVGAVPDIDGYVLLDGTNRRAALAAMGVPRVMVQVIPYADPHAVQLWTWCHGTQVRMEDILQGAEDLAGVSISSLAPLEAQEALASPLTLAVLLDGRHRYALTRRLATHTSRAEQLCHLVALYEERMTRVDCDPEDVEERAHSVLKVGAGRGRTSGTGSPVEGGTLVAFPPFSRSQVVAMAVQGTLIPAGITRHVLLSGRALRVNLPLEKLDGEGDLEQAQSALERHLSSLQPRIYGEPTILYDS